MKKIFMVLTLSIAFCIASPKLVVLDPASIEIIYLIGGEKNIIGISNLESSKIYPEDKTSKLPSVGTFSHPSLEKIISLKPDIVILSAYSLNLKDKLESFKIKTLSFETKNLEDIAKNTLALGELLDLKDNAKKVVAEYNSKLEYFKQNPISLKGVFIYSENPLMVFGKDTLPSSVLEIMGIKNIAGDVLGNQVGINQEFILKQNPEIILFGLRVTNEDELIKADPLLKNTNAYKNKRIFFIPLHSLLRGTPRIIEQISKVYAELSKSKRN